MERKYLTKRELKLLNTEAMRTPVRCDECGMEFYSLFLYGKKKNIKKCVHHDLLFNEPIWLN